MVMAFLDMTIVSVSLLTIAQYFDKSESEVQWVSDGYSICLAAVSIIAGKVGDKFSAIRINQISMLAFMVFSVTCSLATPNAFWVLIGSRLLQGISASFLCSTTMSCFTTLVEPIDISKTMAYSGIFCTVSTTLGPILGGVLTEYLGWQFIFLINIPIGLVGLICTLSLMPALPPLKEKYFDGLGGVLTILYLALLVFGITKLSTQWIVGLVCIVVAIVLIVLFCFWEKRHTSPVLPKDVLFNYRVISSLAAGIFNFTTYSTMTYQAPFLLQYSFGYNASVSGLLQLPCAVVAAFAGYAAGMLCRKNSASAIRWLGNIISLVGLVIVAVSAITNTVVYVLGSMILAVGMSLFVTGNNTYIMVITPVNSKGAMGGAVQCFRETGFSLGVAVSCLFNDFLNEAMWGEDIPELDGPIPNDYVWVYNQVFLWNVLTFIVFLYFAATLTFVSGFHQYEVAGGFKFIPSKIRAKLAEILRRDEAAGIDPLGNPIRRDENGNVIKTIQKIPAGSH